jgi:hypothetical protein
MAADDDHGRFSFSGVYRGAVARRPCADNRDIVQWIFPLVFSIL